MKRKEAIPAYQECSGCGKAVRWESLAAEFHEDNPIGKKGVLLCPDCVTKRTPQCIK